MTKEFKQGWFQCTQCGNGYIVDEIDFQTEEHVEREACSHCDYGIMLVDWSLWDKPSEENHSQSL